MTYTQQQAKQMFAALNAGLEMIDKALPQFDWGKSFLDAEAIRLLNDAPILMRSAVRNVETRLAPDDFSTVAYAPSVDQPKRDPTEEAIIAGILNVVRADVAEGSYDNWRPVPKPPLGPLVGNLGQDSQDRIQQFATLPDEVTPDVS